ncbi:MAG: alpha/beta hydrolase [Actinobacteria bacterium]|nr:alpha/beta hydrolase [Actinomycetota bacterium]MCG2808325.1 alpha/beta hydrolase [Coriobacteriia bacterium]
MLVQNIEVREHGKRGPDVVVLHGGPGAQGSVASLVASLAPWAHVLEPLMRRAGVYPLTMDQHAHDLHRVAPAKATYIGHSWGAMLALSFASLYPDSVSSVILVGCGAYDEASREVHARRVRDALGPKGVARVSDLERRLAGSDDTEWSDSLLGQIGDVIERAQSVEPIGITVADTTPDAAGNRETWADVVRLQKEGIEPARFSSIACPVLMLHGEQDPHPGTMIRDMLQPHIPQLAYIGIHDCGHVPWYELHGREPFYRALRQWIGGLG